MTATTLLRRTAATLAVASVLGLAACSGDGGGMELNKQTGGAVLGGIGGAVIGSQFGKGTGQIVGVAAGTLLGAFLGSEVGKSLDRADKAAMEQANQRALESGHTGQATAWKNPDSGNSGTITPTKTYQSNGQNCREYQQTITVGGKTEQAHGTACRQPDGSWQVMN